MGKYICYKMTRNHGCEKVLKNSNDNLKMFQALYFQERKRILNVTIKDLKVLCSSAILYISSMVILVQEKLT